MHFELLQNLVKVCTHWKSYQASWSISIDLYAQYVSSFTEVFQWKIIIQVSFYAIQKFYIFSNQQYVIHIQYEKCYRAPTHFLVNTGFSISLHKPQTLWSSHQNECSNSEMLAPVHRRITRACTPCWHLYYRQNLLVASYTTLLPEIHSGMQFLHPSAKFHNHKMRQSLTWFGHT